MRIVSATDTSGEWKTEDMFEDRLLLQSAWVPQVPVDRAVASPKRSVQRGRWQDPEWWRYLPPIEPDCLAFDPSAALGHRVFGERPGSWWCRY